MSPSCGHFGGSVIPGRLSSTGVRSTNSRKRTTAAESESKRNNVSNNFFDVLLYVTSSTKDIAIEGVILIGHVDTVKIIVPGSESR
jgi:hypothetical protein